MDVHVIGLGSSGSIAAISALRNGYDVYVSEQRRRAGENTVCTGLISKETIEFLNKYIPTKRIVLQKIKKAVLHFGKSEISIEHRDGAYVVDRKKMDFLLAKKAGREGAKIKFRDRTSKMLQYRSKNIIGADGASSIVAEHFGFPGIEKFASAVVGKTHEKIVEKGSAHLYFNDYTKGFFSWVVDQGKMQEVGCGVILPNNVRCAFEKFVKGIGIKTKPEKNAVIPLRTRRKTGMRTDGKNVLLVGDAAGHVKAFSGGGVAYGLRIAELSAHYIEKPEEYDAAWKKRYGLVMAQFNFLQSANELLPSGMASFGAGMLKVFGVERFFENKKMDNPLGI